MASRYPSNAYHDDDGRPVEPLQPGISRSERRRYDSRYSDARGSQPSSSRMSDRPEGRGYDRRSATPPPRRPAPGGNRSPQRRTPPKKRRSGNGGNIKAYIFLAVLAVALIAVVLIIVRPGGTDKPAQTAAPVSAETAKPESTIVAPIDVATEPPAQYNNIAEMLGDIGNQVEGLAADQMVHVDDLSIKEGLPEEWLNVLLLGTDERTLSESARTDAMMICSINRNTGEVKLASIMRDLAVQFTDIGEYSGRYRINAANYFGGPNLAMKTVNELFEMNIQHYVMINFFGFGIIAQRLGGVEVDISEAEMNKINEDIVKQYKMAWLAGYTEDSFDPEQTKLEQYGENIHLNGNQTLAYARIRHLEGGDYMRTTRQQTVLKKLLAKVKKLGMMQLVQLGTDVFSMVRTNMELEDIFKVATIVIGNGLNDIETMRLPVAKTYKEEVRNEQGMLYDCDFATNAARLYDFIYE